jgi:hypothetical protein
LFPATGYNKMADAKLVGWELHYGDLVLDPEKMQGNRSWKNVLRKYSLEYKIK